MGPTELSALADDIAANGLLEPLTLTPDGKLLDGRNRERACVMAGVEPMTVVHEGDPFAFSLSKNMTRRHMTVAERAFVAAALVTAAHGRPPKEKTANAVFIDDAAEKLDVPRTTIESAKTILKGGTPEEIASAKSGKAGMRAIADKVRARKKAPATPRPTQVRDEAKNVIRAHKAMHGVYPTVIQAEKESGRSRIVVERALGEVVAEDNIAPQQPNKLSKAQGTHVEARLKVLAAQLEISFEQRVRDGVDKRLAQRDEADGELLEKCKELLSRTTGRVRPPFTNDEYKLVLSALHPDAQSVKRTEAFILFKKKEFLLRSADEKDIEQMRIPSLPKTPADWEARKRAVQEARRAKR
jgi:hypothetical protein